jgi:hypothetical protein
MNYLKSIKEHCIESEMSYLKHLIHGLHCNFILLKIIYFSTVHSFFPFFYKKNHIILLIKLYNNIKHKQHIKKIINKINE